MNTTASERPLVRVINWDESRDLVASFQTNRRVLYIGTWRHETAGGQLGDVQESNVPHNAFEFAFYGSKVRWLGSKKPSHGLSDIYLDGRFEATINAYALQPQANVVKFERHGLDPEELHVLRVVVRRDRDPDATDCYQDVSFVEAEEPVCYPVEMARKRDAEYAVIQANEKTHADPSTWTRIALAARIPDTGVVLSDGPFRTLFDRNIKYLEHCLESPTFCDGEGWTSWLPASNHGRMLAGTANTLRWQEHGRFRHFVSETVDAITRQARPDGYYNYYSERDSYALNSGINSERKNYDRVFWTRGMLAAGRVGAKGAYEGVRRMYDWFNSSTYLPNMLIGGNATNGLPGGPLVHLSPVGKPDDLITTLKYYDQDYWMKELAKGEPLSMTYYPGERPHCYALLGYEAMVDEYTATGDERYLRAVQGGWEAYRTYFKHPGGTTSIMEHYPACVPKGFYVTTTKTGEACGSVFWIDINSKLLQLFPGEQKYAAEIEESLFNVILAAQDDRGYIRYHNLLSGTKQEPGCRNTCCEVSSVSLIARVPELVYSIAPDGLYVNQFVASTISWEQNGEPVRIELATRLPLDPSVQLRLSLARATTFTLHIRVPSWTGNTEIFVNGTAAATGKAGTYVDLTREWSEGDLVEFRLRLEYRLVEYEGVEQPPSARDARYALLYGPILMALVGEGGEIPRLEIGPQELFAALSSPSAVDMSVTIAGTPQHHFLPYWMIDRQPFNCYPILTLDAQTGST